MRRELGILALLLVLAVAGLGVAYGAWAQTLNINATINTGDLKVEIQNAAKVEPAYATVVPVVNEAKDGLEITLGNFYPGAIGSVSFNIANVGSIPVNVEPITLANVPDWLTVSYTGCGQHLSLLADPGHTPPAYQCTIRFEMPMDVTGHTGETVTFTKTTVKATQFNN